jgi:hypothetical protein
LAGADLADKVTLMKEEVLVEGVDGRKGGGAEGTGELGVGRGRRGVLGQWVTQEEVESGWSFVVRLKGLHAHGI